MNKICPQCGETFECHNHEIWNCKCIDVRLTKEARSYLEHRYANRCLCVPCLREVAAQYEYMEDTAQTSTN